VISGVFARHSRDEYKRMIELNGGKNVSSISKSTSFILAGDNMGPSKLEKAQKLGIALMNEDEFLAMLPDNIDVQDNKDNNEREQVVQNKPVEGSLF
ncbi:MAG: BRCT domain-containing protein, partial [Prevotella sp.]